MSFCVNGTGTCYEAWKMNFTMGNLNNTDKRKMFELKLIKKFNAINDGLNIDSSYLGLYNI